MFFAETFDYQGHVVRPSRLELAERTTDPVAKLTKPTMQRELRSFLGLCNVFRRFVPNFEHLSTPIDRKLN